MGAMTVVLTFDFSTQRVPDAAQVLRRVLRPSSDMNDFISAMWVVARSTLRVRGSLKGLSCHEWFAI